MVAAFNPCCGASGKGGDGLAHPRRSMESCVPAWPRSARFEMRRRDLFSLAIPLPWLWRIHASRQSSAADSSAGDPQGLALLRRIQTALGGLNRLASVHDLDWTVTAKTWDAAGSASLDTVRRIRWIRPSVFRKDQHAGNLNVIEFYDGSGGWELVPDGGLLVLKGPELQIVRSEVIEFWPRILLADQDPEYRVGSSAPGIVRIASRIEATVAVDIEVDRNSGLPTRSYGAAQSGRASAGYRTIHQRTEYVEWQTAYGIRWQHKTIKYHDNVKRAEITTTSLKFNSGMRREELA